MTVLSEGRKLLADTANSHTWGNELNFGMVTTLSQRFIVPVGASGHESGLAMTIAAVALGATFDERHMRFDRAMWGTHQSGSVETGGFAELAKDFRKIELALGDGIKRVDESELAPIAKLRRRG